MPSPYNAQRTENNEVLFRKIFSSIWYVEPSATYSFGSIDIPELTAIEYQNNEDGQESKQPSLTEVISGGGLAIIAGSDTTATSLSVLFWLLLSNRSTYDKLQAEVDQYFPPGENALDIAQHPRMPYLNAVM